MLLSSPGERIPLLVSSSGRSNNSNNNKFNNDVTIRTGSNSHRGGQQQQQQQQRKPTTIYDNDSTLRFNRDNNSHASSSSKKRRQQQQQQTGGGSRTSNNNNNNNMNTTKGTTTTAFGWFRRIGRGLHHCTKSVHVSCSNCFHGVTNTNAYIFTKEGTNSVLQSAHTCIEINNNKKNNPSGVGDPYATSIDIDELDPNLFYYEDELIDDDNYDINNNTTTIEKGTEHDDDKNHAAGKLPILRRLLSYLSFPASNYCTYGTNETASVWYNANDQVGTIMSCSVWILIGYSAWTMMLLGQNHHIPILAVAVYWTICSLALASHVKTTLTDPGSIPKQAIPPITQSALLNYQRSTKYHSLCSTCQAYKPRFAHHCRICNRCVARMDHHCPWMNNCIGAANLKFFILFLLYVWIGCAMALLLFATNYFICSDATCEFNVVEIQLVRLMSLLCLGTILFVSSMILNVMYGIISGVGTIDRMQKKAMRTWSIADEEPIPLRDIFGIDSYIWWFVPTDPIFPDYERIMGYSTRQRQHRLAQQQKLLHQAFHGLPIPSNNNNNNLPSHNININNNNNITAASSPNMPTPTPVVGLPYSAKQQLFRPQPSTSNDEGTNNTSRDLRLQTYSLQHTSKYNNKMSYNHLAGMKSAMSDSTVGTTSDNIIMDYTIPSHYSMNPPPANSYDQRKQNLQDLLARSSIHSTRDGGNNNNNNNNSSHSSLNTSSMHRQQTYSTRAAASIGALSSPIMKHSTHSKKGSPIEI